MYQPPNVRLFTCEGDTHKYFYNWIVVRVVDIIRKFFNELKELCDEIIFDQTFGTELVSHSVGHAPPLVSSQAEHFTHLAPRA
jgi:hypothetical protein